MEVLGIVFIAFGVIAVAMGVFRHIYFKESSWVRITAPITGEFSYTERVIPTMGRGYKSKTNPVTRTQARILYNVDGKLYEKTVFTDNRKAVGIYYRRSNPNYLYTAEEFESHKGVAALVAGIVFGAVMIALGTALILTNI